MQWSVPHCTAVCLNGFCLVSVAVLSKINDDDDDDMACVVCYIDVGDCVPVAVFGHALPLLSSQSVYLLFLTVSLQWCVVFVLMGPTVAT